MLFFLTSNDWKNMRIMLSPTFTSSKLKNLFTIMSDCAVNCADYVSKLSEEEREFQALISKYANDLPPTEVDSQNLFYLYSRESSLAGLN